MKNSEKRKKNFFNLSFMWKFVRIKCLNSLCRKCIKIKLNQVQTGSAEDTSVRFSLNFLVVGFLGVGTLSVQ